MEKSNEIADLAKALAKAQGEFKPPIKNKTVKTNTYKFSYATLDAVIDAVRKPLAENALSISQGLADTPNGLRLVTLLAHESGQWLSTQTPLEIQQTGMQALGSAISYARRYGISNILGITADEDDDGNTADGKKYEVVKETPTVDVSPLPLPDALQRISGLMKKKGVALAAVVKKMGDNPRKLTSEQQEELIVWLEKL